MVVAVERLRSSDRGASQIRSTAAKSFLVVSAEVGLNAVRTRARLVGGSIGDATPCRDIVSIEEVVRTTIRWVAKEWFELFTRRRFDHVAVAGRQCSGIGICIIAVHGLHVLRCRRTRRIEDPGVGVELRKRALFPFATVVGVTIVKGRVVRSVRVAGVAWNSARRGDGNVDIIGSRRLNDRSPHHLRASGRIKSHVAAGPVERSVVDRRELEHVIENVTGLDARAAVDQHLLCRWGHTETEFDLSYGVCRCWLDITERYRTEDSNDRHEFRKHCHR